MTDLKALGLRSASFVAGFDGAKRIRRVIINVQAKQKVGKDHFALTAPGPIVLFNLDMGLEGVIERFLPKKDIVVAGMPGTGDVKRGIFPHFHFARPPLVGEEKLKSEGYLQRVKKAAVPIWNRFISDYGEALESKARTLIIDTQTGLYQLGKFAFHGMDKVTQKDDPYGQKGGELKSIFQGLIADGLSHDKNVIWLSREGEEWKGGQPTGKAKSAGYGDIGYEVQFTVRLTKRVRRGEILRLAEIIDCRETMFADAEGMTFGDEDEPRATFPSVMAAVYGTEVGVWK